jgi:hypothetical protein
VEANKEKLKSKTEKYPERMEANQEKSDSVAVRRKLLPGVNGTQSLATR